MKASWRLMVTLAAVFGMPALAEIPAITPEGNSEAIAHPRLIATDLKASTITEAQIRQILDAILIASNRRDIAGILKYMAPTAAIEMTLQTQGGGSQRLRLTRDDYRRYLEQGFELTQRYSGTISDVKVQIAANGKAATAVYTLTEETVLKGQPLLITAVSKEAIKFELVQGQILATLVRSASIIDVKRTEGS